jgi:hypothetical protein
MLPEIFIVFAFAGIVVPLVGSSLSSKPDPPKPKPQVESVSDDKEEILIVRIPKKKG